MSEMLDQDQHQHPPRSNTIIRIAMVLAWLAGLAACCHGEIARFANRAAEQPMWLTVVTNLNIDTSLFVPLLLVAPFVWFGRFGSNSGTQFQTQQGSNVLTSATVALLVGALAYAAACQVGGSTVTNTHNRFDELPPAYHDEYSYLFQASTFLAGQTSFPSKEPAGVFDQMHVLNDGAFASRYFPSTGLWMAPFVAANQPYQGQYLANALIAALLSFAACRIGGAAAGLIGGSLIAIAPGMAIFSNLLLAHHPSLVGLSLFVVAFMEARRHFPLLFGLVSGIGLTFAMLGRPMTAAGFALPFGVWLLFAMSRRVEQGRASLLRLAVGLGVPIVCGFVALVVYNHSITGDYFTTPYSVYTDKHTPNHVYGFNNVHRGNLIDAPQRIAKYDGWAENLTPSVAARNVRNRLVASFQWTLGLIPNLMLAVFAVCFWPRLRFEGRLLLASIFSLHIAHIPYWFDGIMHYHYVFESSVLWCALAGIVVVDVWRLLEIRLISLPTVWLVTSILIASASAWFSIPHPVVANSNLFARPRIQAEIDGMAFSRLKYARLRARVNALPQPVLVLVEHDPADIHIEYVTNPPALDEPVLLGHLSAFQKAKDSHLLFPGRTVYVYSARDDTLTRLQDSDRR